MPDIALGLLLGAGATLVITLLIGGCTVWTMQRALSGKPVLGKELKGMKVFLPNEERRAQVQAEKKQRVALKKELEKFNHPSLNPSQRAQYERAKEELRKGSPFAGPVAKG